MDTSPPQPARDASRTSAVWVTGTGAFLLLAAAATFVAVRWEDIPAAAKLATIGLLTGGFLVAGRRLRPTLPATAGALFHLGAFLVPVDVAAVGVRVGFEWPAMLLAQGAIATVTFAFAARAEGSVVLRWAAWASVVALAGGVGATTPAAAGLVLSVVALAAVITGRQRAGIGWATVAGLAPLAAWAEDLVVPGTGTMARLGLVGDQPRQVAVLSGLLAGAALGIAGGRRRDAGLVIIGAGAALVGATASWNALDPGAGADLVGLAALFALIELAALATRRDPFWRLVTHPVGVLAEVLASVGLFAGLLALAAAPLSVVQGTQGGIAAAVAGGAWALGLARRDGDWWPAPSAVAISTASAALLLSGSTVPVATVLAALAVLSAVLQRRMPACLPVLFISSAWAPGQPGLPAALAVATGVAGAVALALAAARGPGDGDPAAVALAIWSLVPLAIATAAAAGEVRPAVALAAVVALAHGLAAILDRSSVQLDQLRLGAILRFLTPMALGSVDALSPGATAWVAATIVVAGLADAIRLGQPVLTVPAGLALPMMVGALCLANGYDVPAVGVALTLTAVVVAGVGSLVATAWQGPAAGTATVCAAAGLVLASGDPTDLGNALLLTGGLLGGAGWIGGHPVATVAGSVVATLGVWLRLDAAEVVASEPYLAPVAAALLAVGIAARRGGVAGSWVAYAPAVGLAGIPALTERLAGGGGLHALYAGTVGIVAVVAGGARRLAAPLLLGTALLVALVGYETVAVTAGVPTWAWLALGGSALLGAGMAMERNDTGPIETGRRLIDVLHDRFA